MLSRRQVLTHWLHDHADWAFWIFFALLNILLFLPLALLDGDSIALLPPLSVFTAGPWPALNQLVLWRDSLDPWRISIELALVTALWVNVRRLRRRPVAWLIVFVYLLAFAYAIYEAIVVSIYRAPPVFYSHYFLARDGLPFLLEHVGASLALYSMAAIGAGIGAVFIVSLLYLMLAAGAHLRPLSRWAIGGIAAACMAAALVYQSYTAQPEMVTSSLAWKLERNIAASLQLQKTVATYDDSAIRETYDYRDLRLKHKPDIYLIFVESYGSVLYKRPDFRSAYTALLDELESRLNSHGWQAMSTLSRSPTWGGGSWLAYTSFLFGLHIDNQPQYLELRDRYQVFRYPSLGRALQNQGYYYAWVSSLEENLSEGAWAKYKNLLGPDRWLRNRDLEYSGPLYGWGPAPPDQYVLQYTRDLLQRQVDQPLLYVTITQNSHYPWDLPPALLADWREFNTMPAEVTTTGDDIDHADKRRRYLSAVEYELQMLADFILSSKDEDSIFVLIGDHQPPQVSRRADGWETPVHIIAKDRGLLDSFAPYGFVPGLHADPTKQPVRHEGMYSLLMRELFANYGSSSMAAPEYWPDGASWDRSTTSVSIQDQTHEEKTP